jgi:transposase
MAGEAKLESLTPKSERKSGGRRPLPAHLERVEEIIEPHAAPCSCGACARVKIGEDVSERLDVVPPKFRVIVTRRPRYACSACRESIVQAPAPARLIEGGIATERLLAAIAVSKYADGLPLYSAGGDLCPRKDRSAAQSDGRLDGTCGIPSQSLAERLFQIVRAGERIFADETTLPVRARAGSNTERLSSDISSGRPPVRRRRTTHRCLSLRRQSRRRTARTPPRRMARDSPVRRLQRLSSTRRSRPPPGGPATLAGCWSHLRREFYKLHVEGVSHTATWTVQRMADLWALEAQIKGHNPQDRLDARRVASTPVVDELMARWENELPRISENPSSPR